MNKQPIKIAICGFGRFAKKRILPALNATAKLELAAIIDRDSNKLKLPNNVLRFNSINEMLNSSGIDSVYVATPNYLHASQTIKCLKKGFHVICEKPMAINKNDCLKMIQTAKENNLQLSVGHMLRYSDAINKVRDLIKSNTLGKLSSLELFFNYDIKFTERDWADSRKYSGGGALIDAGIHCIDVIQFLLGTNIKLKNIDSIKANKKNIENEIKCSFLSGDINCSIKINSNMKYDSSLIVNSLNGKLILKNFASTSGSVDINFISSKNSIKNYLIEVDVTRTYLKQIDDFANSISSGKPDYNYAEQATEAIGMVEKIYEISKLSTI
jgi:predicted dehydrogenase